MSLHAYQQLQNLIYVRAKNILKKNEGPLIIVVPNEKMHHLDKCENFAHAPLRGVTQTGVEMNPEGNLRFRDMEDLRIWSSSKAKDIKFYKVAYFGGVKEHGEVVGEPIQ